MAAIVIYGYYDLLDRIFYLPCFTDIQNGDIALWKKSRLERNDSVDIC